MNLVFCGVDFQPRHTRRTLIVGLYSALGVRLCMIAAGRGVEWRIAGVAVMALVVGMWWVLARVAAIEIPEDVRNRAFFRAYQTLCTAIILVLLYVMLAATEVQGRWWLPHTFGDYNAILLTFLIVASTLPQAFIAWSQELSC